MDTDAINYNGCGLTAINLKPCMQLVDTYSNRLMAFAKCSTCAGVISVSEYWESVSFIIHNYFYYFLLFLIR